MKQAMQKLKKNKKGFTLVELLVVLVILAILAAAIIPSMMGFIDKAKEQSAAAECRSVLLAAEVHLNELYGKGTLPKNAADVYTFGDPDIEQVKKIADLTGTPSNIKATIKADKHAVVTAATYTTSDGKIYTYTATVAGNDGKWTKTN